MERKKLEAAQAIADYYNKSTSEELSLETLRGMIDEAGFVNDCNTPYGICHDDDIKVFINKDDDAVVITKQRYSDAIYLTVRVDFSYPTHMDDEDAREYAAQKVIEDALAHIHTKENGIQIENIELCDVDYE